MSNTHSSTSKHSRPPVSPRQPTAPEIVDPRWILKAFGVAAAIALVCAYIVLCVAFHYTQWEYVLSPSREVKATPASVGLSFSGVRFGVDASGQPQLDGWWIPSDSSTDPTVLMLHRGDGSISDAIPQAKMLHDARLNVLLFDYRGYGKSGGQHPTEALMEGDAESALTYLTQTRDLQPANILVYGNGLGASLAVTLCQHHNHLSALLLESPEGDMEDRVLHDNRVKLVPARWLFTQRFPLAATLHELSTPKLIISYADKQPQKLHDAGDPKMTVEFKSAQDPSALDQVIRRFLDTYLTQTPSALTAPTHP